jgi:prephenate dehydrogenase
MQNPLVVGYKGEIGSFILNGLLRVMPKALNVWCVDVHENHAETVDRIMKSDYIFLCVPIEKTIMWIKKYRNLLRGKVIYEQASLKKWIYDELNESALRLDVRSMHILFRPSSTPNLADRYVALFREQNANINDPDIGEITQSHILYYNDAYEHDKEMAIQQAVLHRTLLSLGKLLKNHNGKTYISQKVIELSDRIKKGNKDLYRFIQSNEHTADMLVMLESEINNFDINEYWK